LKRVESVFRENPKIKQIVYYLSPVFGLLSFLEDSFLKCCFYFFLSPCNISSDNKRNK
jgi:hypothetical protein